MPPRPGIRACLVLLCCVFATVSLLAQKPAEPAPDPSPPYKSPRTIEDLAKMTGNFNHLQRGAAELKKKYKDLVEVERAYKPSTRGGIGIGPRGPFDGFEHKIIGLGRGAKPVAAERALKNDKANLIKLAQTTMAINEITRLFFTKPVRDKGAKEWAKYTDEVKVGAEDLLKAIKVNDPAAVKKSARKILDGCTNCHANFR